MTVRTTVIVYVQLIFSRLIFLLRNLSKRTKTTAINIRVSKISASATIESWTFCGFIGVGGA